MVATRDTRALTVAGQPAQLGARYLGDGVTALAVVVSRWLDAVVEIRANDPIMTVDELVAVAESLRSLTLDEWQTRLKELGFASRDATSDPQSTRIDLGDQQQGTIKWHASVLIPPGFQTNSTDQRRACLQVTFEGITIPETCCYQHGDEGRAGVCRRRSRTAVLLYHRRLRSLVGAVDHSPVASSAVRGRVRSHRAAASTVDRARSVAFAPNHHTPIAQYGGFARIAPLNASKGRRVSRMVAVLAVTPPPGPGR